LRPIVAGGLPPPKEDEDRAEWHRKHYEAQAQRDAEIDAQEADPTRHPGRELRAGRAPGHYLYYQQRGEANKGKSVRAGATTDVREGERFPHPGDPESLWPRVSAGQDPDGRVPLFQRGGFSTRGGLRLAPIGTTRRLGLSLQHHRIAGGPLPGNSVHWRRPCSS
jgi:hypothetical protein